MFAYQAPILYKNLYALTLILLPITVLFMLMPVIDYVIARRLGLNYREYALLVFTTTARNSGALLAIVATVLPGTLIPLVVAVRPSLELPLLSLILKLITFIKKRYTSLDKSY